MSPWGKVYLERVDFNPAWYTPFGAWRCWCNGLAEIPESRRVTRHMDALERELRRPNDPGYWARAT